MATTSSGGSSSRPKRPWVTLSLLGLSVALLVASIIWWAPRQRRAGVEEGHVAGVQSAAQALQEGDLSLLGLSAEEAVAFCDAAAEVKAAGFTTSRCNAMIAEMVRSVAGSGVTVEPVETPVRGSKP